MKVISLTDKETFVDICDRRLITQIKGRKVMFNIVLFKSKFWKYYCGESFREDNSQIIKIIRTYLL